MKERAGGQSLDSRGGKPDEPCGPEEPTLSGTTAAADGRQIDSFGSSIGLTGTMVAHFEVGDLLGAGGFGQVYRARDTRLGRMVAIKVLPRNFALDADRRERFRREAMAASALNHPNICTVHDLVEADGQTLIVMELVEGKTLREARTAGPLAVADALPIAIQIVDALGEAHRAGILHRDVKSSNIALTSRGQVKVLDFGLAKFVGSESWTERSTLGELTAEGTTLGTLKYMSPEQLLGKPVDRRSDLYSFGVVLYEMVTGQLPFTGSSPTAVSDAILHAEPRDFGELPVPEALKAIIRRLLDKDPAKRYPDAGEAHEALEKLKTRLGPGQRTKLSRGVWAAVAVCVLAVAAVTGWYGHRESRQRWALGTVSEATQLIDAEEFQEAAALLRKARAVLPNDPVLERLWLKATGEATIETVPLGAEVSIRPYMGGPSTWESLGLTPVKAIRIPNVQYVVRIRKPGFAETTLLDWPTIQLEVTLQRDADVPPGMVPVIGGTTRLEYPLYEAPAAGLGEYLIDRTEVTNEAYKEFLNAGGYRRTEFWEQPFVKGKRTIPFAEAISVFVDATGRPGPAGWEAGGFPKGSENDPVTGVSWYEAAAYAQYAGKSLPTVYHWTNAAETAASFLIVPQSNFGLTGVRDVRQGALSGFGTVDMAGNAKEWCWNESLHGERFTLGGGYDEPSYMFIQADAASPWERRPDFGFRCVRLAAPASEQAAARLELKERDFSKEKPVSNEVFAAYKALYSYDRTDLGAKVEATGPGDDWTHETVTIDSAYGERLAVHVFLPKNAAPPYAPVIYFSGSGALYTDTFEPSFLENMAFVPRNGRALVFPIYQSTFERQDNWKPGAGVHRPTLWRDHLIMWSKDLGRTVDYLETRDDIDSSRLAYLGLSWGAGLAPVLLAVDDRFKAAVLWSGGFWFYTWTPESYPFNFAPHMTTPVLMLSDRYDTFFPEVTSQLPMFRSLGTPAKDKRRIVYDSGHAGLPQKEGIRETLTWLDRYLGPVKR